MSIFYLLNYDLLIAKKIMIRFKQCNADIWWGIFWPPSHLKVKHHDMKKLRYTVSCLKICCIFIKPKWRTRGVSKTGVDQEDVGVLPQWFPGRRASQEPLPRPDHWIGKPGTTGKSIRSDCFNKIFGRRILVNFFYYMT